MAVHSPRSFLNLAACGLIAFRSHSQKTSKSQALYSICTSHAEQYSRSDSSYTLSLLLCNRKYCLARFRMNEITCYRDILDVVIYTVGQDGLVSLIELGPCKGIMVGVKHEMITASMLILDSIIMPHYTYVQYTPERTAPLHQNGLVHTIIDFRSFVVSAAAAQSCLTSGTVKTTRTEQTH